MATYYVILTDHGAAKLAAVATGGTFDITQLVIGDANNLPYLPESRIDATALVNEKARIDVDSVTIVDSNKIQVIARIPATIGGFNQHEIGLLDSSGQLVYLGNYTGAYKALLGEGASGETAIEIDIITSGVGDVVIEINPSFTYAEQDWVDDNYVSKLSRAGTVFYHAAKTPPPQSLKANGACVLVASYAALTTAIYCGDALNATAEFGYRCTDNTGTTRSTTGDYIKLPDLRGEFIRGWDDARGVDSGRLFGSSQLASIQLVDSGYNNGLGLFRSNSSTKAGVIADLKLDSINYSDYPDALINDFNWASLGEAIVNNLGFYESSNEAVFAAMRPRNIALLACIYY